MVTIEVKRLNPYLRARSRLALTANKQFGLLLRQGEPHEFCSNIKPRYMITLRFTLDRIRLMCTKTPLGVFLFYVKITPLFSGFSY